MQSTADIRSRVVLSDSAIVQHFKRLGFVTSIQELNFTAEAVEDFVGARIHFWYKPGELERYERNGLLIVAQAQPQAHQPTRDIAVISLGHARVVLGVIPSADAECPRFRRLSETMGS
jgi:hypothetical protein